MSRRLFLLAFLALAAFSPCQAATPVKIFILVGQSNMSGEAEVPPGQATDPHITRWRAGHWVAGMEPTNFMVKAKYSPGMAFALALRRQTGWRIGIVNCAYPGSSIRAWQRGQPHYRRCQAAIQKARSAGVLAGVLMAQGEADTRTRSEAESWPALALHFARDFRSDCGNVRLPFIYAQLGYDPQDGAHPYWTLLQALQPSIAGRNRAMIATDDLSKLPDRLHFDTASQDAAGARFASAYLALTGR